MDLSNVTIPDTCDYYECDHRPSVATEGRFGPEFLCREHFAREHPNQPNPNDR